MYTDTEVTIGKKGQGRDDAVTIILPFTPQTLAEAFRLIDVNGFDMEDPESAAKAMSEITIFSKHSDYLSDDDLKDLFYASDLAERIENLTSYDEELFEALLSKGESVEEALDAVDRGDIVFYANSTLADVAEEFYNEGMFSDEYLMKHIDFESIGRDLIADGYKEVGNGVLYDGPR